MQKGPNNLENNMKQKEMNFTLEIDQNNRTILVKATCQLSQDIRKEILSAIAKKLKQYDYSRALIDLTETSFDYHIPRTGASELVAFMLSLGIPSHAKLAFIYSEAESHRKHYENVSQNAGYNVCYFKKINEAKAWLNE